MKTNLAARKRSDTYKEILFSMNTDHDSGSQETFCRYQSSSSTAWSQLVVSVSHQPPTNCITTTPSHRSRNTVL